MAHRDNGAALSVLSRQTPVPRLKGGVRGLSSIPSLTAGETHKSPHVADARASLTPRGHGASSHDFCCCGQQPSREVKLP